MSKSIIPFLVISIVMVGPPKRAPYLTQPSEHHSIYELPKIDESNFDYWISFIEPTEQELLWRTKIRWHTSLATAAEEAKKLNRPILLWTMNGHPSGET